ncbi:CLUMA_CG011284, isoform A [Clunio marinus]|uniref:CLUMA_CG011284, isoform A n=1 Tax=Clunio marinus TaxID=568069 RepID=A0A1J1IC96_9DIPT|nr:CLUMA_CG011284, isoform A [Clunio marinus]
MSQSFKDKEAFVLDQQRREGEDRIDGGENCAKRKRNQNQTREVKRKTQIVVTASFSLANRYFIISTKQQHSGNFGEVWRVENNKKHSRAFQQHTSKA